MNRSFSQSGMLVTVETDIGVTGIGEGGSPDLIQDLAGSLIGKNPFGIERNDRHGIGVTVDFKTLKQIGSFDKARPAMCTAGQTDR
jgi:L-alanine-DL-glutamate epimerase-like enolase superfamily enzyme